MMRFASLAAASLCLVACSDTGGEAGSGALTPGEAQQLEKAAERIDARAPSPAADKAEALEAEVRARLAEERAAVEER